MGPVDILKAVPTKVLEDAYSDTVKGTLQEVSKIGMDAAKLVRLMLFPLQFASAFQDRLAVYIDRAIRQIPEQNRIAPTQSLALPIAERLRLQEDGSILTDMYVSLLARAMDSERVGEAHPAFVHLIQQLAPDEVLLIENLSKVDPCSYAVTGERGVLSVSRAMEVIAALPVNPEIRQLLANGLVNRVRIAQFDLLPTYIEHLVSLGLVSYTNEPWEKFGWSGAMRSDEHHFWFIRLNEFGQLFHKACLSDKPRVD